MKSSIFQNKLKPVSRSAQAGFNKRNLYNIVLPVAPFNIQHHVVKKIDELMALCDRDQASKDNRNELQQQLRRSAIHALETAETEEEFNKSWHFVRDNFSAITNTPTDIKNLRELILRLAIQGLLIPGNIKAIHQTITFKALTNSDYIYIPEHWEQIPLVKLGQVIGGGTPSRNISSYWGGDIPWISPKEMKFDYIGNSKENLRSRRRKP